MVNLKVISLSIIMSTTYSCGGSSDNNTSGNDLDRTSQDSDSYNNVVTIVEEREIFSLINSHRESVGLNTLSWHKHATKESQTHSKNMATGNTRFGHTGFSDRIDKIENMDQSVTASGENVAQNSNPARAFKAWLRSYGHRRNIEGNYTHTGIGAEMDSNGNWYFTQIFLRK